MAIDISSPISGRHDREVAAGWAGDKFVVNRFDRTGIVVTMEMVPGTSFSRQDVMRATDRDIIVRIACVEGIIGGMTYRINPDLKEYKETR